MYQGRPQFDVGARTDVLANVTKCQAGIMLIRTMAPDVLAMDEITAAADLPAVLEATGCGVGLLATVHGQDVPDYPLLPGVRRRTLVRLQAAGRAPPALPGIGGFCRSTPPGKRGAGHQPDSHRGTDGHAGGGQQSLGLPVFRIGPG